ncbi:MAG: A/G-specific adenine glycosylase [Chitinophagaceae bacterium]
MKNGNLEILIMEHPPDLKEKELKFTKGLIKWHQTKNNRTMPWKGEKDPYKIWLSEIILQQTRVEQGLRYYHRFIEAFPTIHHLANAHEQQVFKLWEGLGYYARCKNLIATAKYISQKLEGIFPNEYENLLALKGVGPYTAAAIASFAFQLPYAVVDGNVFRVLARIFDVELPMDTAEGKNYFTLLANTLLYKKSPSEYNQAIMDFGATICKPQPECVQCFFKKHCLAYSLHKQLALPVKAKKVALKKRWFHYIILNYGEKYAISKRTDRDIWQNLFEFLLIEADNNMAEAKLTLQLEKSYGISKEFITLFTLLNQTTQRLSHQLIYFSFYVIQLKKKPTIDSFIWVNKKELAKFAFPQTLSQLVEKGLS